LAESVKDSVAGHFMWLFNSHDNPGRVQAGEGYRELDRIGPVNYKGLFTPWGEPTDAFYLYRSNYAPKDKEPMVYIVSHTWPSRWTTPGVKNNIAVYSNCDEVELFNDVRTQSLGKKRRNGIGTHFQWDGVDIRYNILYAIGYVNGQPMVTDWIILNHLPYAPNFIELLKNTKHLTQPVAGYKYLYRVNCGGGDYTDENANKWMSDRERSDDKHWGSVSWTNTYDGMPPYFASQRRISNSIRGTRDWKLFQTLRYGREKLQYQFPVQDGEYLVELFFTEPWYGTGGGMDCTGWRMFDVAVNGKVVLKNLDIWQECGSNGIVKKTIKAKITGGQLSISFPKVLTGQAVVSAIAIATINKNAKAAEAPEPIIKILNQLQLGYRMYFVESWLDLGNLQYVDSKSAFTSLPSELFGAELIRQSSSTHPDVSLPTIELTREADVFVGRDTTNALPPSLREFTNTNTRIQNDIGEVFLVYKKRFQQGNRFSLEGDSLLTPFQQKYLVMAQPAANIEPAYDLKPVVVYFVIDAASNGP